VEEFIDVGEAPAQRVWKRLITCEALLILGERDDAVIHSSAVLCGHVRLA